MAQSMIGPLPYLSWADSPFTAPSLAGYWHQESFEDGLLNVPGVTVTAGVVYGPAFDCDSVDGDDGIIDGLGRNGRSFFTAAGSTGMTFTFQESVLGTLPTHVGIVWTDGSGLVTFEAFDRNGGIIGSRGPVNLGDNTFNGTTQEDRFFGVVSQAGVHRIRIRNTNGGIEVDHLQYGLAGQRLPLNPRATCLRTDSPDTPASPLVVDLASLGLSPGEVIRIRTAGDYLYGSSAPGAGSTAIAVFSSSNVVLPATVANRVPDAIQCSLPAYVTAATSLGGLPTDVPFDWAAGPSWVDVQIPGTGPTAARYLMVGVDDSYWGDNSDPEGDLAIIIARATPLEITTVFPSCGAPGGGTSVTISGRGFQQGPVSVLVGGSPLVGLQVVDDFTISGITPSGVNGPATVQVQNAGGTVSDPNGFFYDGAGRCLQFDGVDDFARVADAAALDGHSEFTLEFWVKLSDVQRQQGLVSKMNSVSGTFTDDAYGVWVQNGNVVYEVYGPSSGVLVPAAVLAPDRWTHIGLVKDAANLTLFVDGAVASTTPFSGPVYSVAADLLFGCQRWQGSPGLFLGGSMDEVRLWSMARSQSEIGAARGSYLAPSTPGLVGMWHMDEATGQIVADSSPLALHGSLGPTTTLESSDPTWAIGDVPWSMRCATASSASYGSGCVGPAGVPSITTLQRPILGTTYQISVSNLSPQSLTFMMTGWTMQAINIGAFTPAGAGCLLRVGTDYQTPMIGTSVYSLAIPIDPAFLGAAIHNQAVQLEISGGNLASVSTSNAVRAVMGNP